MPVERIPWADFLRRWYRVWKQGEHVTIIAPTGRGKTVLATELVERRTYVVAFATKPVDANLNKLKSRGYFVMRKWHPPEKRHTRVVLWPQGPKGGHPLDLLPAQRKEFDQGLAWLYKRGHYAIWLDELRYMTDYLKMRTFVTMLYTQARSLDISVVGCTQRPSMVPLEAYSQAGHLILFRTGDERDLERIGSLNGLSGRVASRIADQLSFHEFLHVDMVNQTMTVSQLDIRQIGKRPLPIRERITQRKEGE